MKVKLKDIVKKELSKFYELTEDKHKLYEFDIDCSKMPKEFDLKKRKESYFGELFTTLDNLNCPCIYWFECENKEEALKAENTINEFRKEQEKLEKSKRRTIPAKNKNKDSKVIYVGIRQGGIRKRDGLTHISNRIFWHLGYYSKGSTQGLQLIHWSKFKLHLSVIQLPKEAKKYLNILEKFFAIKLKPLLGTH